MKQIALLFFLLNMTSASGVSGTNLAENPGFDEGPVRAAATPVSGWFIRSEREDFGFHRLDEKVFRSGPRSACISIPESRSNGRGYFANKFWNVEAGKFYRFSFWARFTPGKGGNAVAVYDLYDSAGKHRFGSTRTWNVAPSEQWTEYKMEVQIPKAGHRDGYRIRIQLALKGPGTVWFDDVGLQEVSAPPCKVEFYPSSVNTEQALFPIAGEACHWLIYVFSDDSDGEWMLHLDAPAGFKLMENVTVEGNRDRDRPFSVRKEQNRLHYRIPLSPRAVLPMARFTGDLYTGTGLLFGPCAPGTPDDRLDWRVEHRGRVEKSGRLLIRVLPPSAGRLPEHFSLITWYAPLLGSLKNDRAFEARLDVLRRSGFRGGGAVIPERNDLLRVAGFTVWYNIWHPTPEYCLTKMLAGNRFEQTFSMRAARLKGFDQPVMNWNYEPGLREYYHFCPDCRAAFERESGLTTSGADAKTVESRFPEAFLKFRSEQYRELFTRYSRLLRKNGIRPALCAFAFRPHPTPETLLAQRRNMGDLQSCRDLLDFYLPQVYVRSEILWDHLRANLEAWPGIIPCYTSDERHNGTSYGYALLTPDDVYLSTMISAVLGVRNVMLFLGEYTFDGRQTLALRRALDEIAHFEPWLFSGQDAPAELTVQQASPAIRTALRIHGGTRLLVIVNPHAYEAGEAVFRLQPGRNDFSLVDPLRGTVLCSGDKEVFHSGDNVPLTLPPATVRFFQVRAPGVSGFRREPCAPERSAVPREEFRRGGWHCRETDRGDMEVVCKDRKWVVKTGDGAVLTGPGVWYAAAGEGGLFRDLFWLPKEANWSVDCRMRYRKTAMNVTRENRLEISFSHRLRHPRLDGLTLEKNYRFLPDGSSVQVRVRITNTGSGPRSFAYWAHHRPDVQRASAVFRVPGAAALIPHTLEGENFFLRPPADARVDAGPFVFSWTQTKFDRFYFWCGDRPSVEMIGPAVSLNPGESWEVLLTAEPKP